MPRNSIVAETGTGFQVVDALSSPEVSSNHFRQIQPRYEKDHKQFITTIEYRSQSVDETRAVTYAPTRKAQLSDPPTETPIIWPNGPPSSLGMMALEACAME